MEKRTLLFVACGIKLNVFTSHFADACYAIIVLHLFRLFMSYYFSIVAFFSGLWLL